MRCNRGFVNFGDIWPPLTSYTFVPVAECKIVIYHTWIGWIDGSQRGVEVIHAKKQKIRAQSFGLLQMSCDFSLISSRPDLAECGAGSERLHKSRALAEMLLYQSSRNPGNLCTLGGCLLLRLVS